MDTDDKFREFYLSLKEENKEKAKAMAERYVELKLSKEE
jgi:hypothetical protein